MPSRICTTAAALMAGLIAIITMLTAAPVSATEQIDPSAYPELAPEAVLPAMLAELRHNLPDVYSVREVRICPATHIKLEGGKPKDWAIRYEFNAKNQAGGYTGIRRDVAIFRDSHIKYSTGTSPQLGREGLDGVFSKMVDKQMALCKPIPDS